MLVSGGMCGLVRVVDKVPPHLAYLSDAHAAAMRDPVCEFLHADLRCEEFIAPVFNLSGGLKFNYVFNCAADTRLGLEESIYYANTHVPCIRFAREAATRQVDKFILLSTGEIYSPDNRPHREDDKLAPWTALAKSFVQTEKELRTIPNLPVIILRPAIIYGPGDMTGGIERRLICGAVYKHLNERMKTLFTPDLKMNTVHVSDVCLAMWHAATLLPVGSVFNLCDKGNTDQQCINMLVERIFGIKTGFWGAFWSNFTMLYPGSAIEDINTKHMQPWVDLCSQAGITNTPLSPFSDADHLSHWHLCVDGSRIESTGFAYTKPAITQELVLEQLHYYIQMHLFPPLT
ncbi:NAD-dependent epimerase/dehydratase family protein [Pelomyxa schiedti]|nr:NAD-dependent epimerase/dehydratase family protein [Pelomyxa schiedti]